jgi:hypothetical protein
VQYSSRHTGGRRYGRNKLIPEGNKKKLRRMIYLPVMEVLVHVVSKGGGWTDERSEIVAGFQPISLKKGGLLPNIIGVNQ